MVACAQNPQTPSISCVQSSVCINWSTHSSNFMSHFCFVSLESIWGIFSCHRTEPTHWFTKNIFLAKKLQFLRHLHVCYQLQQLPPFFRVIFTEKKCFYHFAYFGVHSNLSMTSKPNSDADAGQPSRLTLSQVTGPSHSSLPTHVTQEHVSAELRVIDLWGHSHMIETRVAKLWMAKDFCIPLCYSSAALPGILLSM